MQPGMIGLVCMGSGMVQRLQRASRSCVVFDQNPSAIQALAGSDVAGSTDLLAVIMRSNNRQASTC